MLLADSVSSSMVNTYESQELVLRHTQKLVLCFDRSISVQDCTALHFYIHSHIRDALTS